MLGEHVSAVHPGMGDRQDPWLVPEQATGRDTLKRSRTGPGCVRDGSGQTHWSAPTERRRKSTAGIEPGARSHDAVG